MKDVFEFLSEHYGELSYAVWGCIVGMSQDHYHNYVIHKRNTFLNHELKQGKLLEALQGSRAMLGSVCRAFYKDSPNLCDILKNESSYTENRDFTQGARKDIADCIISHFSHEMSCREDEMRVFFIRARLLNQNPLRTNEDLPF